jgi:hypothetical protein
MSTASMLKHALERLDTLVRHTLIPTYVMYAVTLAPIDLDYVVTVFVDAHALHNHIIIV